MIGETDEGDENKKSPELTPDDLKNDPKRDPSFGLEEGRRSKRGDER